MTRFILLAIGLSLLASSAFAQEFNLDFGDGPSLSGRTVQLILLITVLSIAPGIAVMITCFPFVVTVLSILRQAIGLQQAPPNMMIVSLALFLTWYIMDPVFNQAWTNGILPLSKEEIEISVAFNEIIAPFRQFMGQRLDPDTYIKLAELRDGSFVGDPAQAPLSVLVPSFMLSEIKLAFQIGFLIFLPFLIIDMVVAAVLMSMGMMMVPPVIVSLPFKLAFFVVADGWTLISSALVKSYLS